MIDTPSKMTVRTKLFLAIWKFAIAKVKPRQELEYWCSPNDIATLG